MIRTMWHHFWKADIFSQDFIQIIDEPLIDED